MSRLSERIRQLKQHVHSLNNRVNDFSNITTEPDSISRFKRGLITGPIAPIVVQPLHQGHSQAVGKIIPKAQGVIMDIFIDDILEEGVTNLSYKFTNLDLKVADTEMMGIIYQANGIVRVQKISLIYSSEFKKYLLNIHSNQPFSQGRIFIPVNLVVTLSNYTLRDVILEPIPIDQGPGSGTGCRPTPTVSTWPTFETFTIPEESVSSTNQKIINPFK